MLTLEAARVAPLRGGFDPHTHQFMLYQFAFTGVPRWGGHLTLNSI